MKTYLIDFIGCAKYIFFIRKSQWDQLDPTDLTVYLEGLTPSDDTFESECEVTVFPSKKRNV